MATAAGAAAEAALWLSWHVPLPSGGQSPLQVSQDRTVRTELRAVPVATAETVHTCPVEAHQAAVVVAVVRVRRVVLVEAAEEVVPAAWCG